MGFCLLSFPPNERLTFCVVINRLLRKINGTKIHNTSIILYAPDAGTQKCDSLFFVCSNLGPEIVPITCHSFVNHQIQGNFQNLQRGQEIWPEAFFLFWQNLIWQKISHCIFSAICFGKMFAMCKMFGKSTHLKKCFCTATLCLRPHKKGHWALHVYSIANFVASCLIWLQMLWNDSKWVSICLINQLKSFEFIWNHLESFNSWTDKICNTINMQRSLSFFVVSLGLSVGIQKMRLYKDFDHIVHWTYGGAVQPRCTLWKA